MLKYFNDGTLQVETLDLPQECGEVKVSLEVEEEINNCNLYLEFQCPKNVKYISKKLAKIAPKSYEIILPNGISNHIGEVYVQLVIMLQDESKIVGRSLIGRNPLFVIKASILASQALASKDKIDFFEHAEKITEQVEKQITEVQDFAAKIENDISESCNNTINNVNITLNDWKNLVDNGKFDGVSFEYCGEWAVGTKYYSGQNGEKKISVVTIINSDVVSSYVCVKTGVATAQNNPQSSSDWQKITGVNVSGKFDKTSVKNAVDSSTSNVYSASYTNTLLAKKIDTTKANELLNKKLDVTKANELLSEKLDTAVANELLLGKFDKANIAQSVGTSIDKVISQKTTTDLLAGKVDNSKFDELVKIVGFGSGEKTLEVKNSKGIFISYGGTGNGAFNTYADGTKIVSIDNVAGVFVVGSGGRYCVTCWNKAGTRNVATTNNIASLKLIFTNCYGSTVAVEEK